LKNLKEADESKIATIESNEKWHNENKDTISIYDRYLNSDDHYYKKLTEASDYYLKQKGDAPQ